MSGRQDELQLLETLVTGDASAWRTFVERYQGLVYARISRTAAEANRSLPTADAEDICADVFSGLVADNFASLRRFEGRSKLSTWLSVIARRVCLRRISRDSAVSNQQEQLDEAQGTPEGALSRLIAREDLERMQVCVSQLSEADQLIVKLYFEENFSYQQISDRLGVSINTVGPKLHRAQQRLRKLMAEPVPTPAPRSNDE